MPGTNQFLPFATGVGANVLTPAAYAALTTVVANGFSAGIADAQQLNTVWRQASFVAAAIAQIIADGGVNANDDGDLTTFKNNLLASLQNTGAQGAFKNLSASSTGTNANVSVSADTVIVKNSAGKYLSLDNVALTIAGTSVGANALDAGTIAANTWYSVWVIWNGTTAAGLLSTSATAPTLPGGYTHKARVGWIRTDGTGNKYPLSFIQYGRRVQYKVVVGSNLTALPVMASSSVGVVGASIAWSAFAPPTASKLCVTVAATGAAAGPAYASIGPNTVAQFDQALSTATAVSQTNSCELMPESANIFWTLSVSGAGNQGLVQSIGWEDNL